MTAFGLGVAAGRASIEFGQPPTAATDEANKFLGRLLEFIPGDIVAGYVAVLALLPSSSNGYGPHWASAIVFLVLAPVVVGLGFISERRREKQRVWEWAQWPWFRLVATPLAFCAWAFALPDSPVNDWIDAAGWLQSLVLVSVTILLTSVAPAVEN